MSVYFVSRSFYEGPAGKHLRTFQGEDSVLGWFRDRWSGTPDPNAPDDPMAATLGCGVYGFALFEAIAEHGLPVPQTMAELVAQISEHCYVNEWHFTDHTL